MRASIFLDLEKVQIRSNGSSDLRFIAVDVDDCTIFFNGYGAEHASNVQRLGEGLIKASMELHSLLACDKDKAEHEAEMERLLSREDGPSSLDQHDTLEEHREEK
jgi:hypothetical protein